jgi:hypothetical protein
VRSALGGVTIDKNGTVTGNVRAGTTIATAGTIARHHGHHGHRGFTGLSRSSQISGS